MHPVIFKLGPLAVYSYGTLVALGFAAAVFLISRRAAAFGLDKNRVIDLAILILISGIIGARAFYVLLNVGYYAARPMEMFNLSRGGLVWYGGFLAAIPVFFIYTKRAGIKFLDMADLISPYVALAQAAGRMGCFLNGCCFGVPADSGCSLGVMIPGEDIIRHPVQLYSVAALLAIYFILRIWQEKRHFAGEIFLVYCVLYSLKRFFIEFLRGDNARILLNLTISQVISLVIFIIALTFLIYRTAKWKKNISGT